MGSINQCWSLTGPCYIYILVAKKYPVQSRQGLPHVQTGTYSLIIRAIIIAYLFTSLPHNSRSYYEVQEVQCENPTHACTSTVHFLQSCIRLDMYVVYVVLRNSPRLTYCAAEMKPSHHDIKTHQDDASPALVLMMMGKFSSYYK